MTQKQEKEFNEVCGFNPEMDIPTIIRNRQEVLDQERIDQENAIIEEGYDKHCELVSGKAEEAEDKLRYQ